MTEQATGHPEPSEETRPGQRTVLVVDLDGEPLAPLRALEEILLCLGTWEDDDRGDVGTDTEPLRLPEPLAGRSPSPPCSACSPLWRPPSPGDPGAAGCSPRTAATSTRR